MNVYNGNIETNGSGSGYATVTLPDYFETLNRDFRYQLTVIGAFAQAVVWQEITNSHFVIRTDKPNVKVSWQVTEIRKDKWANENRIVVEEDKAVKERGFYLHPELHGLTETRGIEWALQPEMMQEMRDIRNHSTTRLRNKTSEHLKLGEYHV